MMTCQEMADFLMAYLDDELPAAQRQEFQQHLEACPPCVHYIRTYEQTVELGKTACQHPDDDIPEDVPEQLVQAILKARRLPGG